MTREYFISGFNSQFATIEKCREFADWTVLTGLNAYPVTISACYRDEEGYYVVDSGIDEVESWHG